MPLQSQFFSISVFNQNILIVSVEKLILFVKFPVSGTDLKNYIMTKSIKKIVFASSELSHRDKTPSKKRTFILDIEKVTSGTLYRYILEVFVKVTF